MPKIAINCAFYQPKGGGIKEYIHNLVTNLSDIDHENEIIIYILQDQLDFAKAHLKTKFKIKTIPFKSTLKKDRIIRSLFEKKFWQKEEKLEKFDIFHSPFFHSPTFKNAKVLLTVHDLRLYRFPETYEFFRYQFLKRKVKKSIRQADHIISISNFTKKEIIELCDVDEDKITVVYEAINRNFFNDNGLSTPDDLPEALMKKPFILSVGHLEPRKNYMRLIDSFVNLKNQKGFEDLQLVIVGKKDHSYEEVLKKIQITPELHYLNFVSGNTLLWLYKNASLFVFPSYYEGFGFPPLEAASIGTISAVSNVSSIPEVCGDSVIYFNPYDINEMTEAIKLGLLENDVKEKIKRRLMPNLNRFSWKKNAEETKRIYEILKNS